MRGQCTVSESFVHRAFTAIIISAISSSGISSIRIRNSSRSSSGSSRIIIIIISRSSNISSINSSIGVITMLRRAILNAGRVPQSVSHGIVRCLLSILLIDGVNLGGRII